MTEQTMRCDRCKHWNAGSGHEDWEAKKAEFGECMAVRARWIIADEASEGIERFDAEFSEAAEQRWIDARAAALRKARAYVQDGSEYRAELYTAPDFFCALYAVGEQAPGKES
jgi:hypothetical protein